jgi:hypothetical protein
MPMTFKPAYDQETVELLRTVLDQAWDALPPLRDAARRPLERPGTIARVLRERLDIATIDDRQAAV